MTQADEDDEGMGTGGEIRRSPDQLPRRTEKPRGLWRAWLRAAPFLISRGARSHAEAAVEARAREEAAALTAEAGSRGGGASDEDPGYRVYGEFIKDELEAQDKRKASFEQRGLAVITTSGTLVTLLFALAALSTKQAATFTLPSSARDWLFGALVLFFFSALAALLSNAPFVYQAVPAKNIRERLREKPPRSSDAATRDVAFSRLDALESAKKLNGIKGWALLTAMALEAFAVGCVAVAITIIL